MSVPERGPAEASTLTAVAAGGAIGAASRYLLTLSVPGEVAAVLLVNLIGCATMGILIALTDPQIHRGRRAFLGIGFLGGFTTVSTYAVLTLDLWAQDRFLGLVHLVLTPVLAVAATGVGVSVARRLRPVR